MQGQSYNQLLFVPENDKATLAPDSRGALFSFSSSLKAPVADQPQGAKQPAGKRAKRKTAGKERFEALCNEYGNVCLCCGKTKRLTIDHVIPKSKGGKNDVSNWQPLCQRCNSKKGVESTDYRPTIEKAGT